MREQSGLLHVEEACEGLFGGRRRPRMNICALAGCRADRTSVFAARGRKLVRAASQDRSGPVDESSLSDFGGRREAAAITEALTGFGGLTLDILSPRDSPSPEPRGFFVFGCSGAAGRRCVHAVRGDGDAERFSA